MKRTLLLAIVGGILLASISGAAWIASNGEDTGAVGDDSAVHLDVALDEQDVRIENASDTPVTVTAIHDETGDTREIAAPGKPTRNRTLEPGDYTLRGEADDRKVVLEGQEELPISIPESTGNDSVRILDATDPVVVGESLEVTAEIGNEGDAEAEAEISLDIDDREGLDNTTVVLGPGETETITLTYQPTESDLGERDVTVRGPSDSATETVEVRDSSGGDETEDEGGTGGGVGTGDGDANGAESGANHGGNNADEGEGADFQPIDSCTEITESGAYEVVEDIEGDAAAFSEDRDACVRIAASDVILEGNDEEVVGTGEDETIGVLVAGTREAAAENVTIRNLRVANWDTGVRIGNAGDEGEARLEDVTASENEGSGVHVRYSGSVDVEAVTANDNGHHGIEISEGAVDSMVDVAANGNGGSGIAMDYTREMVAEGITVSENGRDGIEFSADAYRNEFSAVHASDNAGTGISIGGDSSGNVVRDSTIENNGGPGIRHGENDRTEFRNVTVRDHGDWQVTADAKDQYVWFSAADLRIGETATFAFDEESVYLDSVARTEFEELPENAQAIGDGVDVDGVDESVGVTLEYDETESDRQIELWRYDGEEWTAEETFDGEAADGSLESTLTEDGIYAPVLVDADGNADGNGNTDADADEYEDEDADGSVEYQTIDSCTVISDSGAYEVVEDVERKGEPVGDDHDDACLRITASDVVLEGNGNTIIGASAVDYPPATIGVLVAGTEGAAAENVTIRNLRAEGWDPGIQIGTSTSSIDDREGQDEVRLWDVTVSENENHGVYVGASGSVEIETIDASRNGGKGIYVSEGAVGSMADVTASDNGQHGIHISEGAVGSMAEVTANENGLDGVDIGEITGVSLERITANGNGRQGIDVSETREVIAEGITASENDRAGVAFGVDVYRSEFSEVYASDNGGAGVSIGGDSSRNVVRDSTIENNDGAGISYVESAGNEFRNVMVRGNGERQLDAYDDQTFSATELRIGETAEFTFEEEVVSLDDVEQDDRPELPANARAVGDGVDVEGIDDSVDLTLEYDESEAEGQVELWRYDGDEWTTEETIDGEETDGSLESSLTADGIYAPISVE